MGATYHDVATAAASGKNANTIANDTLALYGAKSHITFTFGTMNWTAVYLFKEGNYVYLDI